MRTGICGLLSLLLVFGGWPAPALEQLVGAKLAYADGISLKEACVKLGFLTPERFDEVFHPEEMA